MNILPDCLACLIPPNKRALLAEAGDRKVLGGPLSMLLERYVDNFYGEGFKECVNQSKILLDIIWEKLNTGNWKDVNLSWRFSYTVVSFVKALSQCCIMLLAKHFAENAPSTSNPPIDLEIVMKTIDMGLLMGAPILDNVLTRLATAALGALSDNKDDRQRNHETVKVEHSSLHPDRDNEPQMTEDLALGAKKRTVEMEACDSSAKKTKLNVQETPEVDPNRQVPVCSCPSLEHFKTYFMDLSHPVVITNVIDYWPAFNHRKWSLDYLKRLAGYRTVPIEIGSKYTEDSWSQKLMTFGEFVDEFIENKQDGASVGYLAQHQLFNQIPELQRDISIPTYCCLGDDDGDEDVDINAWFGPSGTISPLHFDPKHNLLAQVVGEKYIRLFGEEQTTTLYPHSGRLLSNTSQVDVENPDLDKYPEFAKASYLECILKPGQMLYMPPKCWHYVRSLSISFSVSFWWQ